MSATDPAPRHRDDGVPAAAAGPAAVRLDPIGTGGADDRWPGWLAAAGAAHGRVGPALDLARELGHAVPLPGAGRTLARWELLAGLAAADLTVARVVEPHLDALAILAEAGRSATAADDGTDPARTQPDRVWGVFASGGPASTVRATAVGPAYRLDGVKPWCSLAGSISDALLVADGPAGSQLFALPLRHGGVRVAAVDWVARGLAEVSSGPIELSAVPATAVGGPGWYVDRPGFAWGGIGVAACWYGGAVGVARTAWTQVHRKRSDIAAAQFGAVDIALHGARAALAESARMIDDPATPPAAFPVLAQRVRAVVAAAAENVLRDAGHLLGPAPLAFDDDHARRVADLALYVRQQHGERDAAALATMLTEASDAPY